MDRLITAIINEVLDPLIFLFFGLAVLYFLFGLVKYIANTDNEEKRKIGQRHILFSLIGLVIMTGAWGLLQFVDNSLEQIAPGENTTLDEYRQLNN